MKRNNTEPHLEDSQYANAARYRYRLLGYAFDVYVVSDPHSETFGAVLPVTDGLPNYTYRCECLSNQDSDDVAYIALCAYEQRFGHLLARA